MFRRNMAVLAIGAAPAALISGAAAARITARWESKGELR
jgi:hypothetical protein